MQYTKEKHFTKKKQLLCSGTMTFGETGKKFLKKVDKQTDDEEIFVDRNSQLGTRKNDGNVRGITEALFKIQKFGTPQ